MRRITIIALLLFLLPSSPISAQTYGYKREQDPLVLGVKKAIGRARAGDMKGVRRIVGELRWQTDELKRDVRVDLERPLAEAIDGKDATRIAYALTHLVFQAMRQKFYWNEQEGLAKHVAARARLDSAQFYYEEILSHAVRRADKATRSDRHREILTHLRRMRETLGSPGLFGVGGKSPNVDRFRKLGAEIETLLREVYPDFAASAPETKDGE